MEVRRWIDSDETAIEMLKRVFTQRPSLMIPPPLHRIPLRSGNVVEIAGPSPFAMTQILLQGVLLLNAVFTEAIKPTHILRKDGNSSLMLPSGPFQKRRKGLSSMHKQKMRLIDEAKHHILKAAHP